MSIGDWQCDLGILYYGDLLEGGLFKVELYEILCLVVYLAALT
jgi:hypothetical protein